MQCVLRMDIGEGSASCWLLVEVNPARATMRVLDLSATFDPRAPSSGDPSLVLPVARARAETPRAARERLVRAAAMDPALRPLVLEAVSRGSDAAVHLVPGALPLDPARGPVPLTPDGERDVPSLACPSPTGERVKRFHSFLSSTAARLVCVHCGSHRNDHGLSSRLQGAHS